MPVPTIKSLAQVYALAIFRQYAGTPTAASRYFGGFAFFADLRHNR